MLTSTKVSAVMGALGVAVILMLGCATKRPMVGGVYPTITPTMIPVAHESDDILVVKKAYRVETGDTLWGITKQLDADPMLWPILWKANRDYILDPDWIEVGEVIEVPERTTEDDLDWARAVSAEWPRRGKAKSLRVP